MKRIIFFFLFPIFCFSQINNIKITYDIKLIEENFKNTDDPIYRRLEENAENTELIFEKYNDVSTCYLVNDNEKDVVLYSLISLYKSKYFDFKKKSKLLIRKSKFHLQYA